MYSTLFLRTWGFEPHQSSSPPNRRLLVSPASQSVLTRPGCQEDTVRFSTICWICMAREWVTALFPYYNRQSFIFFLGRSHRRASQGSSLLQPPSFILFTCSTWQHHESMAHGAERCRWHTWWLHRTWWWCFDQGEIARSRQRVSAGCQRLNSNCPSAHTQASVFSSVCCVELLPSCGPF